MVSSNGGGSSSGGFGRASPPRVALPKKGVLLGVGWSGAQGAGNQIMVAKVDLGATKAKLSQVWRPFTDAPGRRDVLQRLPEFLAEAARWAEGKLVVGFDFPFSLSETHLRQLNLLRQAIRGPAALGKAIEERFLPQGVDFSEAAEVFRDQLGKERVRLTDGYRATPNSPAGQKLYRHTFFGLVALSKLGDDVNFVPWDPPVAGQTSVVEVCPFHVARVLTGSQAFADDARDGVSRSNQRAVLLRTMRTASKLEFDMETAASIVEDERGDGMRAVLAAVGAGAAAAAGFEGVPANVPRSEGWIYSVREEPWRDE
ncbi:DUF429 domain-containing protein [Anaeromyxobacter paludicola]|uniref:DUF429 domain-containing protein n=1 Tax=Anaeromyxobacter paludicola TaxID=2918171 RepID=A0ABM7XBV2_9BACT|nr:DUF429 domain-containing protein [Anaeromyxobacter paludicola]BDG09301.1 hypothetical protein AMPC_24140 [Anaeromyxobacter paludicola]